MPQGILLVRGGAESIGSTVVGYLIGHSPHQVVSGDALTCPKTLASLLHRPDTVIHMEHPA